MKILIDARLYGLENAGLGRYTTNLIAGLSKTDKKNEYAVILRKKYYDSITLPDNWKKVLGDFRHYSLEEQIRLPNIIASEKPDLTHFVHFNVPITFNGKFVVTVHDMLMHKFAGLAATSLPAPIYLFKQLIYRVVFRNAVKKSAAIVVPSESVKKEIVKYYKIDPSKIKVTYEGVDGNIGVKEKENVKKPYFVYTGNAYPHKNLARLIEAVVLLNKNIEKKATLAIASSRGVFTKRLEKEIDKLKAGGFVKLLGFVPDDKLGFLYKNSEAFVFPSLSEGFGLPGLEAMSAGTIVLASDIPVFREIYKDNATYFNPLDFSSIETAMRNVLSLNGDIRSEKISNSQKFIKRYSWEKMARETLSIYESCTRI